MSVLRFYSLGLCLLVSLASRAVASDQDYTDGMVRAAVIFGILRYTEWPQAIQPLNYINLCAQGDSPAASAISSLTKVPNIGQTKINFVQGYAGSEGSPCHAAILGASAMDVSGIQPHTLLICDTCANDVKDNSAIELMLEDSRIQFDINLDIVHPQGIRFSAELLELAAHCTSKRTNIRGCDD